MAEAVPPSTLKLRVTSPARALRLRAALLVIRSPLVPVSVASETKGVASTLITRAKAVLATLSVVPCPST